MAVGERLPEIDHIARGCGRGEHDGEVTSAAFAPTPRDKGKLSTDWVECPKIATNERNVAGAARRLKMQLRKYPDQLITILPVARVRGCSVDGHRLDAVEDPLDTWISHAAVVGMSETGTTEADFQLQDLLAEVANQCDRLRLNSII